MDVLDDAVDKVKEAAQEAADLVKEETEPVKEEAQEKPKPAKSSGFLNTLKNVLVGLVIGLVLGAVATHFLMNYNPKDEPETGPEILAASAVFERYVSQNELVGVSQKYNITEKASDTSHKIPFTDITVPFLTNSFWYRYVGTIKAGVDLSTAELAQNDYEITVTLDQPYIISNTVDREKSGVLEENNNFLNPINIEDIDAFFKQCTEASEEQAIEEGILDEAKLRVEENLDQLFTAALGEEYHVTIEWRSAE